MAARVVAPPVDGDVVDGHVHEVLVPQALPHGRREVRHPALLAHRLAQAFSVDFPVFLSLVRMIVEHVLIRPERRHDVQHAVVEAEGGETHDGQVPELNDVVGRIHGAAVVQLDEAGRDRQVRHEGALLELHDAAAVGSGSLGEDADRPEFLFNSGMFVDNLLSLFERRDGLGPSFFGAASVYKHALEAGDQRSEDRSILVAYSRNKTRVKRTYYQPQDLEPPQVVADDRWSFLFFLGVEWSTLFLSKPFRVVYILFELVAEPGKPAEEALHTSEKFIPEFQATLALSKERL